ncbi:hypothetical protein [Candidatus Odyssella acanthamoebae]|uniref:Uncharacterized protein n=1 Tax=Candidatus Odyssella acanthamoebae TaxID=91604 RepID=A0A077ASP3_9PROT|nr:hypothetical protein [Candidatus Paracaedibacter acanthamoebae]AIK96222.1 hypothetical protein ID47_04880 [Candidatus Paracaedibacter acanthamoebae]
MKGTYMRELEKHAPMMVGWLTKHSKKTAKEEGEKEIQKGFNSVTQRTHISFQTFINVLGTRLTPIRLDLEGQILDKESMNKLGSLRGVTCEDSQYDTAQRYFRRVYRSGMFGEDSTDYEENSEPHLNIWQLGEDSTGDEEDLGPHLSIWQVSEKDSEDVDHEGYAHREET